MHTGKQASCTFMNAVWNLKAGCLRAGSAHGSLPPWWVESQWLPGACWNWLLAAIYIHILFVHSRLYDWPFVCYLISRAGGLVLQDHYCLYACSSDPVHEHLWTSQAARSIIARTVRSVCSLRKMVRCAYVHWASLGQCVRKKVSILLGQLAAYIMIHHKVIMTKYQSAEL